MTGGLVITVQLHERRYHGSGEWPPAPARVFQALVAGVSRGVKLATTHVDGLSWLERLPAPVIACPHAVRGQQVLTYVPNNDLDARGGDPSEQAEIRVGKRIRPWLLESTPTFHYVWSVDAEAPNLQHVVRDLYQLGRGVDMAWGCAEVMSQDEIGTLLANHRGVIYRPTGGRDGTPLSCPCDGTLKSLRTRHSRDRQRFEFADRRVLFERAPKGVFRSVMYEAPPRRFLFELRRDDRDASFDRPALSGAAALTTRVRDRAMQRLAAALPTRAGEIETAFRNRDGKRAPERRIRILVLPSIGSEHADRGLRRVLVEVPGTASLSAGDVEWAFSGLVLRESIDEATGEILEQVSLSPAADWKMARHFGIGSAQGARRWRSVTAAALPESAARRRIDPARRSGDAKGGGELAREMAGARLAVAHALRHAGAKARAVHIRVQRESFEAREAHAESFAEGSRFDKKRLWHVDITLDRAVAGPMVLGDGRFIGLGLMAPVREDAAHGVFSLYVTEGLEADADPRELAHCLRRATIARVQEVLGPRANVPTYFHGHLEDGRPSGCGHAHVSYQADLARGRLLIIAPHACEYGGLVEDRKHLRTLMDALEGFTILTAGRSGRLCLAPGSIDEANDPVLAQGTQWRSITAYAVCRHHKNLAPEAALCADVRAEMRRRGLPSAEIHCTGVQLGPRGGLAGAVQLRFCRPVRGPISLGRTSHMGGGLFESFG